MWWCKGKMISSANAMVCACKLIYALGSRYQHGYIFFRLSNENTVLNRGIRVHTRMCARACVCACVRVSQ